MRIETLYGVTRQQAKVACPWAAVIVKVEGAYIAFESPEDHRTWRRQA